MTINAKTLFDPSLEKDNCGFGLIAQRNGKRSRKLVKKSILGLTSMTHRGAIGADGKTGDGCGLLFDLNHSFFKLKVGGELDVELPDFFAVAQIFHKNDIDFYYSSIRKFLNSQDLDIAVTRSVPVNNEVLGKIARQNLPNISQVFITSKNTNLNKERFEACLLQARKFIEEKFDNDEEFYVCSMSTQTIVYKGLMLPSAIDQFYLDLKDENVPIAVNLQKFSEPAQRYCPAGVYEVILENEKDPRFQINAQNCLHCKTCDIKDPSQNITWRTPQGGEGPNYSNM